MVCANPESWWRPKLSHFFPQSYLTFYQPFVGGGEPNDLVQAPPQPVKPLRSPFLRCQCAIERPQRVLTGRLPPFGCLFCASILVRVAVVLGFRSTHARFKHFHPHHPIWPAMSLFGRYDCSTRVDPNFAGVFPARDNTDGSYGTLIASSLPDRADHSDLAQRMWKIVLRRWWGAWADGLFVLEPRRWWLETGRLWCWATSPSRTEFRVLAPSEIRSSTRLALTIAGLHERGLPHGGLEDGYSLCGSAGELVAPPNLDIVLTTNSEAREKLDRACIGATGAEEAGSESPSHTALELLATLQGEEVAAFEMVYSFSVKEPDVANGDRAQDPTILLNRSLPHPVLGNLHRPNAASLFESLLRESEGERLELIANDSPDPFDYDGARAVILNSPDDDEDALVIRPMDKKPFPAKGWVRPRSEGSRALVRRKRSILQTASKKRQIVRWFGQSSASPSNYDRETLKVSVVENEGIFCVQGPPGTGKTHLACDVVEEWLKRDPHARILVCAKEHNALHLLRDRVLSRLGTGAPQSSTVDRTSDLSDPSLAVSDITFSFAWAKKLVQSGPAEGTPTRWTQALERWHGQPPPILVRIHQRSSQLLFTTTTAASVHEDLTSGTAEPFDLVVVEEAGKCYPSELLSVLGQGRNALLIGDQRQLPPFQADEVSVAINDIERLWGEEEGRERLLEYNPALFERVRAAPDFSWNEVRSCLLPFKQLQEAGCPSFILSDQYRMVPILSDMVSSIFYPRQFSHKRPRESCSPLFHHPALDGSPLVWVDVPHSRKQPRAREDPTGERFSEIELSIVSALVRELKPADVSGGSIAILSPYNAQVDRLAGRSGIPARLPSKLPALAGIDPRALVRTVDSFQGNEADLVILSLVRNNPFATARNAWGFLISPERLNVMLSRARRQLVIVGCSDHVRAHSPDPEMKYLAAVLRYVEEHGRIVPIDQLGVRP